jgi:hypothetical protein
VRLPKLALVFGATLMLILPTGGCSSKSDENKEPKLTGDAPKLKPVSRGAAGAPEKPSGPGGQAPVSKP